MSTTGIENWALDPKDVASVILNILASGAGGIIEEVLLAPQKKNILFKRN